MADKYVNNTGLQYFYNRLKTVFAGKSDFETLQDEVEGLITEGGEPNVIEEVQKNGTALPITNKAVNITVPTSTSDLTNDGDGDSNFATESYVNANGGKIDKIKVNNSEQTITNKTVNITVPTKTTDLTNDSGFQTASDVNGAIDDALADISTLDYEVVQSLPSEGAKGIIYLMANSGTAPNIYDEYIWTGTAFEKIGTTDVDLSGYWNETNLIAITTAEIDAIVV